MLSTSTSTSPSVSAGTGTGAGASASAGAGAGTGTEHEHEHGPENPGNAISLPFPPPMLARTVLTTLKQWLVGKMYKPVHAYTVNSVKYALRCAHSQQIATNMLSSVRIHCK